MDEAEKPCAVAGVARHAGMDDGRWLGSPQPLPRGLVEGGRLVALVECNVAAVQRLPIPINMTGWAAQRAAWGGCTESGLGPALGPAWGAA